METYETIYSPRLNHLRETLANEGFSALEQFWQEIGSAGTPLVEAIPGNQQEVWVTFLYRSGQDQAQIGVVSNLSGKMGEYQEMIQLPGTDIRYRTYRLPSDTRETYQLSINGQNITDPLNPKKHLFPLDEDTGVGGWESSLLELPDAPSQTWSVPHPGVPAGQVVKHYYRSEILGNVYPVWIYTPPGYSPDIAPYGFLLMLDGWFYRNLMPAPTILDNLLAEGKILPMAAIMVGSLSYEEVRKRDYGCYPPYIDFLTQELLPWARHKAHLADIPKQSAIVGASRGGLMAGYIALRLPGVFGGVLSQSGSFGWRPAGESDPNWLVRQYEEQPRLPLRFYLEAGSFETELTMVDGFAIDLLASNRAMREVLQNRGYPIHYREFSGDHSPAIWRGTLADGLLALFGNQTE